MPVMALRGVNVFPGMVFHFDIEHKKSGKAIEDVMERGQLMFLVARRELVPDHPFDKSIYDIGTVSKIRQTLRLPNDTVRVMSEGLYRASWTELKQLEPFTIATVSRIPDKKIRVKSEREEALVRRVAELFEEYAELAPRMVGEIHARVASITECGYMADFITQNISARLPEKQAVLSELNPYKRLERVAELLMREIEILSLQNDIQDKLRGQLLNNQREYILREQMKTIQHELGEGDDVFSELQEYRNRIDELILSEEAKKKLHGEVNRLSKQSSGSPEAAVIRTYLDTCLELPWNKKTRECISVEHAQRVLNSDHSGLEKVKERVLEYIAVKRLAPKIKGQILCLVGPPGVGKTSVALSIARAMGRKAARLSLGGVRDEADIRGHRKTYIGAMPGRIMTAIRQAGSRNAVLLLDEIDKMGNDFRGDPAAAMLEVLDPEQNVAFRDHYIEIPFDLSDVFFITTANTTQTIPPALLDRMELIELTSYTDEEKLLIMKKHLIPKQLALHGLKKSNLSIGDDIIREIIAGYTRESGVRKLERQFASICRKTAKMVATGETGRVVLNGDMLHRMLGARKFKQERLRASDEIGLATGLAWTRVGGEVLEVEVGTATGSGKVELTGNLGDIMKESARAALTYIRGRCTELKIDENFYKDTDLHVHFPESATPKDGPSAGITMAVAMASALSGMPVRRDVAMTGEITLRGRVLAVGGLKEKTMAAFRMGIKKVIVPAENEKDIEEIDSTVRSAVQFIYAEHMDEVLDATLISGDTANDA